MEITGLFRLKLNARNVQKNKWINVTRLMNVYYFLKNNNMKKDINFYKVGDNLIACSNDEIKEGDTHLEILGLS